MIAGPSGVGKGTIVKQLLERDPNLRLSVSATTRGRRPTEREGADYFFVSNPRFDELVASGALLEWAEVFGHRSGTPADAVQEALDAGHDVVLEIDVQGAGQVRERMSSNGGFAAEGPRTKTSSPSAWPRRPRSCGRRPVSTTSS